MSRELVFFESMSTDELAPPKMISIPRAFSISIFGMGFRISHFESSYWNLNLNLNLEWCMMIYGLVRVRLIPYFNDYFHYRYFKIPSSKVYGINHFAVYYLLKQFLLRVVVIAISSLDSAQISPRCTESFIHVSE